jgi:hypothetical protein
MEIYFGIVQKKVLTPNDFVSLDGVAQRLKEFERHHERVAKPFRVEVHPRRSVTGAAKAS